MPSRPSLPASRAVSRTVSSSMPCSYHSATFGRTRSSTNLRTVSRMARSSSSRRCSVLNRSSGAVPVMSLLFGQFDGGRLDVVLTQQDVVGSRTQRHEAVVRADASGGPGVAGLHERAQDAFADPSGMACLLHDQHP